MCHHHILSHLLKKKNPQSLHCIEAGYHPSTLLQIFPSPSLPLLLSDPVPSPLYPLLRSFFLFLVFLLSSPIVFCLGMLATLQLYSSMHFISIFISDFVTIYFLIYLGLLMHAVCETDSCIYQWNRVRS